MKVLRTTDSVLRTVDNKLLQLDTSTSGGISTVETFASITGDGTLGTPIQLVGDQVSPGSLKYYGTNQGGAKGFYTLPSYIPYSGSTGDVNLGEHSISANLLVSTAITTSPLLVSSSELVSNLNVDLLDNFHGSYYLDYVNFTNIPTGIISGSEQILGLGFVTSSDSGNASLLEGQPGSFYLEYSNFTGIPSGIISSSSQILGLGFITSSDGGNADLLDGFHGSYYLNYNNFVNIPLNIISGSEQILDLGFITSSDGGNASLLEGQPGSYYLNFSNLTGVPSGIVSSSQQISNLGFITSPDGGNADLLDGYHGSYYLNYSNFTGIPSGIISGSSQIANLGYITSPDGGNADLLDGFHGTYYLDYINFSNIPSGIISSSLQISSLGFITSPDGGNASLLQGYPGSFYLDYPNLTNVPLGIISSSQQIADLGFLTEIEGGNADTLDGYDGTYYLDYNNFTNVPIIGNGTLTMGVSGNGLTGTATFTANQTGGSTFTINSNATSNNVANTLVFRDNIGSFSGYLITGSRFISTVTTGSAPFSVNSSTLVEGLNVDMLDGYHAVIASSSLSIPVRDNVGNIDTNSVSLKFLDFEVNTNLLGIEEIPGRVYYNESDDTLNIVHQSGVVQQVGQEVLLPPTSNNSLEIIPNGYFVMATGATGDRMSIAKAITDGSVDPMYMVGVATRDIPIGSETGKIVINGYVRGVNTDSWSPGTVLYPDPSVPGWWTPIKPTAPSIKTPVAMVIKQSPSAGILLIRMTTGSQLGSTDSNVEFTGLEDGDTIHFVNGALARWENNHTVKIFKPGAGIVPLKVNALTGQTADLQTWSVNEALKSYIDKDGKVGGLIFRSLQPTGTAPLIVSSSTVVTNLNADLLDGNHGSYYYPASNPSGYTTNVGTVTSVGLTTPTGLTVTGSPITVSGSLNIAFTSGYSIPTTASQTDWNTAYGWGNHAGLYAPISHSLGSHTNVAIGVDSGQITGQLLRWSGTAWDKWSPTYEQDLGVPSGSGYLLSSTTAGVRSWVAPYSHPSYSPSSVTATAGQVISTFSSNSLGHVTGITLRSLGESDIPALSISKITGLTAALSNKIETSTIGQAEGVAPLDSNAKIATSYLPDSILGQVSYIGNWNASTDTPTLPVASTVKGNYYIVTVAGTYGGIDFQIGDWVISDGVSWTKVDNSDAVTSVFGRIGNVVANAGDYSSFYVRYDAAQTLNTTQQTQARTNIDAAKTSHTHLWSNITNPPPTYAPSSHSHEWADIIDPPSEFAPAAHTLGFHSNVAIGVDSGQVTGQLIRWSGTAWDKWTPNYMTTAHTASSITSTDIISWNTAYSNRITSLTTTGSSGSATLVSNVLNIPAYTLAGLGGQPLITAGTDLQYWRGDKTWQTLNTAAVPESGNLYFTNARAIAAPLTGYVATSGTISSTDSILTAIQKLGYDKHIHSNMTILNGTQESFTTVLKDKLDGIAAGATANTGTVTSVAAIAGTGISVTGSPITTSGTLTITNTAPHIGTNLSFSGTVSPFTLNSSTGTDVTFTAGTGISLSATGTNLTINNTVTDTNTYPTAFAWSNGTTSGPTGSLTGTSPTVSFPAIPSASATISGVVTTTTQTFSGQKQLNGKLIVFYDSGTTGSTPPVYTAGILELYTTNGNVPTLAFHRSGISATALYEYDGELHVNAWAARSQTGKLLSTGNTYFGTDATGYRPLTVNGVTENVSTSDHTHSYLPLSGGTLTGDLLFSNSGTTTRQIRFNPGDNDYARIAAGATASNAGWLEIATADDGTEPIYVRQYSGTFTTAVRTLTLLDGSGNSSFPGTITTPRLDVLGGGWSLGINNITSAASGADIVLNHTGTGGREYHITSTGSGNMSGAGNLQFHDQTANQVRMLITSTGDVTMGVNTASEKLTVNGNIAFGTSGSACKIVHNATTNSIDFIIV